MITDRFLKRLLIFFLKITDRFGKSRRAISWPNERTNTVYTVSCFQIHILYRLACIEKKFAKQFPDLMHPSIEAAFTERRHKPCTADKAKGFFNIPGKVSGGKQDHCDDFCIGRFTALRLFFDS
jgi:hypothetical protein